MPPYIKDPLQLRGKNTNPTYYDGTNNHPVMLTTQSGTVHLTNTNDASNDYTKEPALVIGNTNSRLHIDNNEIQALAGEATADNPKPVTWLGINKNGGQIAFASNANGMTLTPNSELVPNANNNLNLGNSSKKWKNGYFAGTLYGENAEFNSNVTAISKIQVKSPSVDYTASLDSDIKKSMYFIDKNNIVYGALDCDCLANGNRRIYLNIRNKNGNWANSSGAMGVHIDESGNIKNTARTPVATANDTQIATTAWAKSLSKPNLTDTTEHTYTGNAIVVKSFISSDKKTWWREYSDGFKIFKTEGTTDWTSSYYDLPISFGSFSFSDTNYFAVTDYVATYLEDANSAISDRIKRYVQSWSAPITSRAKNSLNALIRGSCTYVVYACGY